MDVLQEKLQNVFMPIADKINAQPHLNALKNAMMQTIPLTIIGGIAMLIAQPPVSPQMAESTNFFIKGLLAWKTWADANAGVLLVPYNLTIGFLAVYIAFLVGYERAKSIKLNGLSVGLMSLLTFLMTAAAPFMLQPDLLADPKNVTKIGNIMSLRNLGGEGMFYAIIVGFVVAEIFRFFKKKDIKLQLPEQVPPNVAAPFEALFPAAFTTVLFILLNVLCMHFTGDNLCRLVFIILTPLMRASSSLPSVIICSMLLSIFWFMGIHGNNIVGAVLTPITTANIALNAEAVLNGTGTMTPLAGAFITIFGNWMSYPAMMICFFLVGKSAHLRSMRKIAVVPDLFNINEPLTFGVPVMLNILIALPIMICNVIMCTIGYLAMQWGIVGSIFITVPWTTPGFLNIFLATTDIKAMIMWLLMFVVDIIILLPFVKMYDKQLLNKEKQVSVTIIEE